MARIDAYLTHIHSQSASDLHLVAGIEPRMRVQGRLRVIEGTTILGDAELRDMMRELPTPVQWQQYEETLELDFAYGLEGVGRFRANFFQQENGAAAIFRLIPEEILTLTELDMPPAVEKFAHLRSGLVLVTGPTGAGKSTTLAALIDLINETYDRHIITIEDPIEFVHHNKNSLITQREVGHHTEDFRTALRAAIRQDADVILVGELRGREVELAILAAEMGTLVFGTLHTNSASKTIDRLIDIFPTDQQDQIRIGLAEALAGVVSQVLVPTADGKGRAAAVEILVKTSGLPNIIREGNTPQLMTVIQGGGQLGMQSMDDALEKLVKAGTIRPKEAYQRAADKQRFEGLLDAPIDAL
ncbi:MAG: PilT/PilU family type 4a pilus ATPase [Myxococcales bacterium]|nr:PilT/PilU family type 4a pilus ATPase [Myxococcales bacterium]